MTKSNCIQCLAAILFITLTSIAQAQQTDLVASIENHQTQLESVSDDDFSSTVAINEIRSYIKSNLVFPEVAADYKFEGNVTLLVSVDENGHIGQYKIKGNKKGVFSNQVLETIENLKRITPVYKNGIATKSTISIPVKFKS